MGAEKTLKWVGFHLLSMPQERIRFPGELSLACMSLGNIWVGVGYWYLSIRQQDSTSEYLFSNLQPLDSDCRMLKATLLGDQWIFVSEVEIIAANVEVNPLDAIPRHELLFP
ncbi:MAG: hypothetical protein A2Z14_14285 [Chloroflexi bacterium RBG_16_48_8]|nr:MAG: hypothetical protein A2Z14_14285 [Chloroflexi bacterium RBG_16_48_8]